MKKRGLLALLFGMAVLSFTILNSCDIDIGLGSAVDTEPPTLTIENPPASKIIRDAFPISGTFSDDGSISAITVELTNTEIQVKYPKIAGTWGKENTWSAVIDPVKSKIPDGKYEATITISDNGGHHSVSTRSFVIDNTPPVLVLSRPASESTETDSSKIQSYGQYLTLKGEVADDNNIEKLVIKIYSKEDPETLLCKKEITNIAPTISLDVAKFLDNDVYSKIYGDDTEAGEKLYNCEISVYDKAKRYPAKSDVRDDDDDGNSEQKYILQSDFDRLNTEYLTATGSTSRISISDLYAVKAGNYDSSDSRSAVTKSYITQLFEKRIAGGSFKLNPRNNPTFSISGLDLGVASDIENERNLTIQLSKGLDEIELDTDNMKVYLIPTTVDENDKETRENKIYPQNSTFEPKGDGQFLTIIQKDNVIDSTGNPVSLEYGKVYVVGVEGADIYGNKIVPSFDGKEFFIRFKAKNVAPGLTVDEPVASTSYLKKGDKLLIKGTTSVPDGYPTVSITCKKGDDTTAIPVYTHKVKDSDKVKIEGGLIYYSWEFEVPTSGSANEFFFDQGDENSDDDASDQYVFDITSDLDSMPTSRTKTVLYDLYGPTISIDTMLPTAEKYNALGDKQAGDYLNGDVTMKVSILDDYDSVNTDIKDSNNDKRPYFIITDENETEIPFRVGTESVKSIKHYITTPAKQQFKIKTEDIASGTDVKNIKVKIFAEDRAGNKGVDIDDRTKKYYERSYTVDQSTDIPWILPKNSATTDLTYTKEQAQDLSNTEVNVYFANQTVMYRMIDDDGLAYAKYQVTKVTDDSEVKAGTIDTKGASEYQLEVTMPDVPGTYKVYLETKDTNTLVDTGSEPKTTSKSFYIRVTAAAPTIEEIQLQETKVRAGIVITPTIKIKSDQVPFKLERKVKKVVGDGDPVECTNLSKTYTFDGSNGTAVSTNLNKESPTVSDTITISSETGKFDSSANYIINYKVIDKNNKDGKGTKEITVDLNAPNITAVNLSGNAYDANSWYNSKTLALEVAAADISGETGIDAVEYSTTGNIWTALSYDSSTSKYAGSAVFNSEGNTNALYIRAKDKAGNIKYFDGTTANGVLSNSPVSINVKIDTSAPVLHISSYKIGDLAAVTDIASSKIYVKDGITLKVSGTYKDDQSGIDTNSLAFEFGTMPAPVVTKDDTTTPPSWTATYTIDKTKSLGELIVKTQNNAGIETQVTPFEIILDNEYPLLKTISLSTNSTNTEVYKKSDIEYYVNNTKQFGTEQTPEFTIAGISTDNKGVAKVTLYEGTGTSKTKIAEKTDSDFSFTGLDWTSRTGSITLTLTATDIAGNENPETLPSGVAEKYKAVTLTIHFDTTGPEGTHQNDSKHKDIYFRLGDQDRDDGVQKDSDGNVVTNPSTGKPTATDGQDWNSELDENVGGKYKKDTFGNKTTITLRGKIDDSGSGVDLIYYKIYHDLSQITSKSDTALISDVVAEKLYFAPFETPETKRVYYNSGSAHADSVESTYRTTISKFVEGQNYLVLVAKDKVGNYSIDTPYDENDVVIKYYSMNVDTTAPVITKTVTKDILYSDGNEFTVEVTVSDPKTKSLTGVDIENSASGIDTVILSTTKGKVAASLKTGTTDTYSANIASILENEKSLTVNAVATDKAGSSSSMIIANVMVDTTEPVVTIITPAANAKTNKNISLNGSVNDGTGSGIKTSEGVTLYYTTSSTVGASKPTSGTDGTIGTTPATKWVAYETKPTLSGQSWTGSFVVPDSVAADGSNTTLYLSVGAVDNAGIDTLRAGNSGYSDTVAVVVDRAAPEKGTVKVDETNTTSLGTNTTVWFKNQTVNLNGNFTDAGGSGVASVKYQVKKAGENTTYGAVQTVASDGEFSVNVKDLANGTNYIKVWSVDTVGNASAAEEYTVKVDDKAPVISSNYTGVIYADSASCPVELTVTDQGGSTIDEVTLTVGDKAPVKCTPESGKYTYDIKELLSDGTVSVTATAKDKAGNETSRVIANVMLDTTGPELAINTPTADAKTTNSIIVKGSASDGTGSGINNATDKGITLYYTTKVPTELTETHTAYGTNETSKIPDTTNGWVAYGTKMTLSGQTWQGTFTVPDSVAAEDANTTLYLSVGAVDMAGSGNPGYSTPVAVVVDRAKPEFTDASSGIGGKSGKTTVNASWFNTTTLNVFGDFTDVGGSGVKSIKYQVKKAGNTTYEAEQTVASDGNFSVNVKDFLVGTNYIKVWAEDTVGNPSDEVEYTVNVDKSKPTVTPGHTGNVYFNGSGTCTVTVSATDTGSGIKNVVITRDGSDADKITINPPASGNIYSADIAGFFSGLNSGTYAITATATDMAENETKLVATSVVIDKDAPVIRITTPADDAKTAETVSFSGTADDGTGAGINTTTGLTLYYTKKVPTKLTETHTTYGENEASLLPDTTHGWGAYATKPSLDKQDWNCSFDASSEATPGSNTTIYFSVGAVDKSGTGNTGYAAVQSIVVDRAKPVKTLFKVNETEEDNINSTWFNNETLNINGTFTDEGGSGVSAILYTLDSGTEQEIPTTDGTFNTNIAGFTTGSHTLKVRAKDKVGNYSGTSPYTIKVDMSQPVISEVNTNDFQQITLSNGTLEKTFSFDVSDTGSGIATAASSVTVKVGSHSITSGNNDSTISVDALSNGNNRVTVTIGADDLKDLEGNNSVIVTVTDQAGNQSNSQSIGTISMDKDAPVPSFASPQANATVNKTITIKGTVTDASNSEITTVTLKANDSLPFLQVNAWNKETSYAKDDVVYVEDEQKFYKCKTVVNSGTEFATTNWDTVDHGYIFYSKGQWAATLDTTELYNEDTSPTTNNLTLTLTAKDKADNTTETAKTLALKIDQNSDRPVVKFTNLVKDDSGKYILKYGNNSALEGTVTDDDAISDAVVKTFFASSSEITSITDWENEKDEDGNETNTWKHTTDDGDEYVEFNSKTGDYTFTPTDGDADGEKKVYFYIVDNDDNVFYTTQTTQLTRPYKQYKTDLKEDNAAAITYNSDSNAPLINSVQLQAYTAATANMVTQGEGANATQVDTTKNGALTALGTNCVVGGTTKNFVDLKVSAKDANGIKGIVIKVEGIKHDSEQDQDVDTVTYYRSNNSVSENGVTTYADIGNVAATQNDSSNHDYTTSRINITDYVNGQVTVTVKVYDNSGLYNNQESVFKIDRDAPTISFDNNVAEGQVVYGINKTPIGGTANATDVDKIYYAVTNGTTASSAVTNWIEVEGQKISASIIFGGSQADAEHGLPSDSLRKWIQTVYSYDDTYMTEHDENKLLSIHFKAVDTCGNAGYTKRTVSVVPNGDKPVITLSYPVDKAVNSHPSLAGTIRVYGNAEVITGSVSAVYVQIDTAYNGTSFNENWKSGFDTCVAGKNTSYEIETFGSGTTAMQGIKAAGTLNWNLPINGAKEFNPTGTNETRTMAIRIYGVGGSGKVSEPVIQEFTIDPNAPHIGGTGSDAGVMQLKLVQFDSSNPLTAGMTYAQAQAAIANQMPYVPGQTVWVKGQWYIAASVYDDAGIATLTLDENQGGEKITLVTGSVKQDNKQINTTQTEKTIFVKANDCKAAINNVANKKNFDIYIPLPTSTGSGNLEFTLEAFEASEFNNSSTETVKVNYDNTPPKLGTVGHDNYNANAYKVQQDNGFYHLFGYATDAEGNNLVSDMKAIAFYFVRRGTATTNPVTKVYDPMWKDKSVTIQTGTTNTTGITYEYGMFWNTKTVGRSSTDLSTLTLTTADDNIHAGGFVLMGGTIYTIRSVSENGLTITLKTEAPAGITTAKFAYAMVIDNFNMTESVDTRQKESDSSKYGYGYYKADATADDGDLMQEKWASGKWEAWINSNNIPDGPIEIHYVALDNAQNFSTGIVGNLSYDDYKTKTTLDVSVNGNKGTASNNLISGFDYIYDANKKAYVSNNAPRIAGVTVGTDYNGNGIVEASEKQTKYVAQKRVQFSGTYTDVAGDITSLFIASGDNTSDGDAMMAIKGAASVEAEIIGGNGNIFYQYSIDGSTYKDHATIAAIAANAAGAFQKNTTAMSITREANEGLANDADYQATYYKATRLPAITFTEAQIKSAVTANTEKTWFTFEFWDSTEETTAFSNSQYAQIKLPVSIQVYDTTPPNTVFNDLYWKSSTDNSVYTNPSTEKLEGHIELKGALTGSTFGTTGGYGTDDDKISGKVVFSGYAYDNKRLSSLSWGIKGTKDGSELEAWPQADGGVTFVHPVTYNAAAGKWGNGSAVFDSTSSYTTDASVAALNIPGAATVAAFKTLIQASTVNISLKKGDADPESTKAYITNVVENEVEISRGYFLDSDTIYSAQVSWSADSGNSTIDNPFYYFKVYDDAAHNAYQNENGHKVYWELIVDTSHVQEPGECSYTDAWAVGKDLQVYVIATDADGQSTDIDETAVTTGTDSQKLKPRYKVDVVPYITGIKSRLDDNRSSNGRYQIADNEFHMDGETKISDIQLIGYNLSVGNANLTIDIPTTSGVYSTSIHGCETINNLNNNEAIGNIATNSTEATKVKNKYNYQPSSYNNSLTDDVYIQLWQFNSKAARTYSGYGFVAEPVVKFNPVNGNLGFAFSNGANRFSMSSGTNYFTNNNTPSSYERWEMNYAKYVANALAFDESGRAHGVSVGIDTQPNSGKAGRMNYFYSGWGRSQYNDQAGNFNNDTNSLHIDTIGVPNPTDYTSSTPPNGNSSTNIVEERFKSTSMVAVNHGDNNYPTVYIAYYDFVLERIVFRWGEITGGKKAYDNLTTTTQTEMSFALGTDKYSLIAGGSPVKNGENIKDGSHYTPYNAGEYVDIGVIKGATKTDDVVCAVWYDARKQNLMYSYKINPCNQDDASETYTSGHWTKAQVLKTRCGEYCKIAVDANGGIHITAYDSGNKGIGYVYMPSYSTTYSEANNYYLIDCINGPYDELGIDVAIGGTNNNYAYPTISYYANGIPKMATFSTGILKGAGNKPDKAWENDSFTGKWDVCFVPTASSVRKDHMNVAQPKNTSGVRARVATGTDRFNAQGEQSYGTVTGNTTTNPILGYAIREGAIGYLEIAQRKE